MRRGIVRGCVAGNEKWIWNGGSDDVSTRDSVREIGSEDSCTLSSLSFIVVNHTKAGSEAAFRVSRWSTMTGEGIY